MTIYYHDKGLGYVYALRRRPPKGKDHRLAGFVGRRGKVYEVRDAICLDPRDVREIDRDAAWLNCPEIVEQMER